MKKFTLLIFIFCAMITTVQAQFIQTNTAIYGSKGLGVANKPQASVSLEDLLERINHSEHQVGWDTQEFTSAERQVLTAYFRSQNANNKGPQATLLTEGFEDVTTLAGAGYTFVNASDVLGLTDWFQGNDAVFPSQAGAPTAYIGVNYNSTAGSVINNFMISPVLNLENGDEITFWTRSTGDIYADRLEVRIDPTGANTDPSGPTGVGSYTELLLEVNPTLISGPSGYPDVWTEYTATVTGLTGAVDTRVAFRYWVTDAGPLGNNSDYIGIDTLTIEEGAGSGGTDPDVYAYNLRTSCGRDFGTFPVPGPYNITPISTFTSNIYGGDYDGSGTLYAMDNDALTLITIDPVSGSVTTVGPLTNLISGQGTRGLAWNEADSTMYLLAGAVDDSSIYTVDLSSGALTLVGTTTNVGVTPIWLAIDNSGNAFAAGLDDNLYSVDLSNGVLTLVGPLGININFAQDADFDPTSGTLYMAAYIGTGVNFFASVDTATGAATQLGSVNSDCAELGLVAIKGEDVVSGNTCEEDNLTGVVVDNGYPASGPFFYATDLTVADTQNFTLNQATFSFLTAAGRTIDEVSVTYYEDDGSGLPGAQIGQELSVVPTSDTNLGPWPVAASFDIHEVVIDLTPFTFDGQVGSETTYWVLARPVNDVAGIVYWSVTANSILGNFGAASSDGVAWVELTTANGASDDFDFIYTWSGECEDIVATNDDCSGALAVSCGDSLVGETITATDSGGNAAPDVFYKFTGSGTQEVVTVSLCTATDFDTVVRIFDDCDLANELAVNDDSCGLQSEVSFLSDGTSTYYIMVEGFGSNSGNFSLDITCEAALPNDGCEGAIAVSCGDSVSGSTVGATADSASPACGPVIDSPGVWYTLEDNSGLAGEITLSLCNGTTFDSKIAVYTGDCPALVCVDGNDDSCGLQSEITFNSDGNTKYYILVHSFNGATGDFTLDVTCTPTPPPNDMIANSIDVDEIGFPYTDPAVVTPAATTENGNPNGCDLTGANGVWYNFVAEGNGSATAMIETPGGASSVTFYSAPDENASETDLTLVAQVTNQCVAGTSASIDMEAGQAYYVFVLNSGAVTDITIDRTLGVSNNAIAGFSFYPNPTTGVINFKSGDNIENISLYNILGQKVVVQNVNATTSQLDISGLSPGAYVMKVVVNGETGTYKVLKE